MKKLSKSFLSFLIIFIIISVIFSLFQNNTDRPAEVGIDQFIAQIEDNNIEQITI